MMKTMFLAQKSNPKKRLKKPNILRKRSKPPPKPCISLDHQSSILKNLVTTSSTQKPKPQFETTTGNQQLSNKSNKPIQGLILDNNVDNEQCSIGELYEIDGNVDTDQSLAVTCEVLTNNHEESFETTINVETFINNSEMEQLVSQADIDSELNNRMNEEWCFDFVNDAEEIIIEDIDGSHLGSLRLASTPAAVVNKEAPSTVTSSPEQINTSTEPVQNITLEYLNYTMNFKCDMPNCSKWFRSEEGLNKHKITHTKSKNMVKFNKPVIIECPVKKILSTGVEESCEVYCSNKNDIIKHLNEAHDPEDAKYICTECGRRFYWAAGLRAHGRSHARGAGGAPWACTWAGCGRAFRQPCRLREHMRAHTGDKPYPCRHPNCGWSFRTASKLLNHARRHTGERRHECGECGRAFRRREHLRDHSATHHALKQGCTHSDNEESSETAINVETFINNNEMEQLVSQTDVDNKLNNRMNEEWCFDFVNDEEIIIEDIDGSHLGSLRLASTPATIVNKEAPSTVTSSPEQINTSTEPVQNITLEYLNYTMNFKCDMPNCSKWFRSEEGLNKHKITHTKSKNMDKSNKPVIIECPVKKLLSTGVEEPCGFICSSKTDIVKHLNEAHNPEDAMYSCTECGRRFYWAAGLRAHGRSHARGAGAAPWACTWAGCGRAFRQPCRLREHMRAHTGDKPYPCRHPNCGWSFRTASKLLRHARRHTGERRHECGECGRAFRRREHLRDHSARHHALKRACTHTGCSMQFHTLEALKSHTETVHREELETAAASIATASIAAECEMFPVAELMADSLPADTLMHAARTHCPWPFPARAPSPRAAYGLDEDGQVEMSEGSESNIYTIRSDLFLHGNVLINEDSEQMVGAGVGAPVAGEGEDEGRGAGAGADSLLGGHAAIDLMQEELLYTDAAVDEASFRVFMLSGDDLT